MGYSASGGVSLVVHAHSNFHFFHARTRMLLLLGSIANVGICVNLRSRQNLSEAFLLGNLSLLKKIPKET